MVAMEVCHLLALKCRCYVHYFFPFSSFPVVSLFFSLPLPLHLPLLPGSSGFFRRTNIPPGVYKLRVIAWDPVRDERAVIRNRILVHRDDTFCAVLKTNNGVTIGRNNNVTIEFSGTGRTTGFQCILDKQQPYFECMLFCGFTMRLTRMFCLPFKFRGHKYSAVAKRPKLPGHKS